MKYKDALVRMLWKKLPNDTFKNLSSDEEFRLYKPLKGFAGVILYKDEESVTGTFFEDADELAKAWDDLFEEVEEDEDEGRSLPKERNHMTDKQRLKWLMPCILVCLARPFPDSDPEMWDEWGDQRDRLMRDLPSVEAFMKDSE